MKKKKILSIFGTRPEAIKMAPLVKCLDHDARFASYICLTGQHQEMLDNVLSLFGIIPHYQLKVMSKDQDLNQTSSKIIEGVSPIIKELSPDLVLVHGDTNSTLSAALAAYYHKIPVGHVEAGLRTGNPYSPWPEEGNRKLTDSISTLKENIKSHQIFLTGNTVVDALMSINALLKSNKELTLDLSKKYDFLNCKKKMVLVTGHRRESFGKGFKEICNALKVISENYSDVQIVYPVHLNPNVNKPVKQQLSKQANILLLPPQDYLSFVYLMERSYLILTDSGGIQEEAPSLGKPVLLMRDTTERSEGINSGVVRLVGANSENIVKNTETILTNQKEYKKMSSFNNPYGDGYAAKKICNAIGAYFG